MIPFDFDYYKPTTITEAIETYQILEKQRKRISYYGGGTEFITYARVNKLVSDAVIDLKGIPACKVLEVYDNKIVIGSAVTLNQLTESGIFPLLGEKVKQIADHTSRNKITIGGNINSNMIYREGLLPLLLVDAEVVIAGNEGERTLPLMELFHEKIELADSYYIAQILIDKEYAGIPFYSIKRTKSSKVGYPIVSIAALVKDKELRISFSGVCAYPFRTNKIEEIINDRTISTKDKINSVIAALPAPIVDDIQGSSKYRKFVLKNTLWQTMEALEEYVV